MVETRKVKRAAVTLMLRNIAVYNASAGVRLLRRRFYPSFLLCSFLDAAALLSSFPFRRRLGKCLRLHRPWCYPSNC